MAVVRCRREALNDWAGLGWAHINLGSAFSHFQYTWNLSASPSKDKQNNLYWHHQFTVCKYFKNKKLESSVNVLRIRNQNRG